MDVSHRSWIDSSPAIGADGTIYVYVGYQNADDNLYAISNGSTPLTAVSFTTSPASPQPINTPITLTAGATEGRVPYSFSSGSTTRRHKPGTSCKALYLNYLHLDAGGGRLILSLRQRTGCTGAQVSNACWYTVTGAPLTTVSLSNPLPRRSR